MNKLINILKAVANDHPLTHFEWSFPKSAPIDIPSGMSDGYQINIYLKDNFKGVLKADSTLSSHYWTIQEWGGIGSFKRNGNNDFRIRRFLKELEGDVLTKGSFACISSLSKIASFLEPMRYFIYDSRAIYSLNWLLFNYAPEFELFPQPVGRSKELAKYDMQTIFRLSKGCFSYVDERVAFHTYCDLIRRLALNVYGESAAPYHLEMLLFMIAPTWIINDIERRVSVRIDTLAQGNG